MTDRTYTKADGMTVKTANAKQSWQCGNTTSPEVLHQTRRDAFWMECMSYDGEAIAKDIDRVDARAWLVNQGLELPEVLR